MPGGDEEMKENTNPIIEKLQFEYKDECSEIEAKKYNHKNHRRLVDHEIRMLLGRLYPDKNKTVKEK